MATCMHTMVAPVDTSDPKHQYVCLKCKHHSTNKQTMLVNFLNQEKFCDVTLVCEEKLIFAHKVILAMCSSYFQNILTVFEKRDPIVIFKDIKHSIMTALIDFMYKGELFVQQGLVVDILEAAKVLKINSLLEGDNYQITNCEEPGTETVAEHVNVETNLCLEVPNINQQTVSPKKRKFPGLHRKRIRRLMSKKRHLARNATSVNDDDEDDGANSTEELLKVAENVFQQLNDARDKNKALFLAAQSTSFVQEADENLAPMFQKGKSNLICGQSEDSSEDCQEYSSSTSSSHTETPHVNSLVRREDYQEKETNTTHSEKVNTTCNVNITRVNLGSNKENKSNAINKDRSNDDSADDFILHISDDYEDDEIGTNDINEEHSNVDSTDDLSLHFSEDDEENESNTKNKQLPKQSLKVKEKNGAKGRNVVLNNSEDQSVNNSQSLEVKKKRIAKGRNVVLNNSEDQSVGLNNSQSLEVKKKRVAKGRNVVLNNSEDQSVISSHSPKVKKKRKDQNVILNNSDDQSKNTSQLLKVKKKRVAKDKNVASKSSDDQTANNDLPCGSGVLKIDPSHCNDSPGKSMESNPIKKRSEREHVHPNTSDDKAESGNDFTEDTNIYPNEKKSTPKTNRPSKKRKLTPNSRLSTPKSRSKKLRPQENEVETGKMLESQSKSNKKQPRMAKVQTPKSEAKKPNFSEDVIPLTKYLSTPGNSKEGFWKEHWAIRTVRLVSNKKIGNSTALGILDVASEDLAEQVCLRKQTLKQTRSLLPKETYNSTDHGSRDDTDTLSIKASPKPIKSKKIVKVESCVTTNKPTRRSLRPKVTYRYDSTDHDSGDDSDTLSIKASPKPIRSKKINKVESCVPFSFSDNGGDSSDSWDAVDECLSIGEESDHASVTVNPAPLTCSLNLKPVPVLRSSEYSDDDVSQESSRFSEEF